MESKSIPANKPVFQLFLGGQGVNRDRVGYSSWVMIWAKTSCLCSLSQKNDSSWHLPYSLLTEKKFENYNTCTCTWSWSVAHVRDDGVLIKRHTQGTACYT